MLGADLKALFQLYGERFVNDLVDKMNEKRINATGTAARSIRYKATQRKLTITAAQYLSAVDAGLTSLSYKGKKPPSTTNNGLERWAKAKVRPDLGDKDIKKLAYAIARGIKKNGTIKRFEYTGAKLVDFVLNKQLGPLTDDIAEHILKDIDKEFNLKLSTYKDIKVK